MRDWEIEGFSAYCFRVKSDQIIKNNGMLVKRSLTKGTFKLKADTGVWRSISLATLKRLAGLGDYVPLTAKKVPGTGGKTLITEDGEVFVKGTPGKSNGKLQRHIIGSNGYPKVSVRYADRKNKPVELHILLLRTFVMADYIEKGLCALHGDDDKLNFSLDNLEVGTYSKNNKDAYTSKLNPGNGLKKRK